MVSDTTYCDWIAVDWGTSNLRAWAMRGSTAVAEATSDDGMAALEKDQFEPTLLRLIDPWLGRGSMQVIACGMVGARQGWFEAPYASTPCQPIGANLAKGKVRDPRLHVRIVPGVKQTSPPDVMRGEETQIAGFLARAPGFDGVLCLPGTHTKWVHVSAGEIVSFRTFMTGETFALLSKRSVLRHSITDGWDAEAFANAVSDAMAKPEAMTARLFQIRAAHLLNDASSVTANAQLSGLLIGSELAASRPYWLGQNVVIVGDATLASHYATALALQSVDAQINNATDVTLAGLSVAYSLITETTP